MSRCTSGALVHPRTWTGNGFARLRVSRPLLAVALLSLAHPGCDALPTPPGKPSEADRYVAETEVVDFESLYAMHCSGCHGADGTLGPARALRDPLYLALVPREVLARTIRSGVRGTPMPAFGHTEGGPLTDAQLTALVDGLTQSWGGEAPSDLPPYAADPSSPGSAEQGLAEFQRFCADCHGGDGRGGERGGSVVNSAYLGMVSDQGLRTSVIVGRRDLDMPDYRSYVPGRAMRAREITDVVAWLVSQRPRHPGQPYPSTDDAGAARPEDSRGHAQEGPYGHEEERSS